MILGSAVPQKYKHEPQMRAEYAILTFIATTLKKKKDVKLILVTFFILPDIPKILPLQGMIKNFKLLIFYILLFIPSLQNPVYISHL